MKRFEVSIQQPDCLITGFTDQKSNVFVLINTGNAFELNWPSEHEIKTYTTADQQNLTFQSVRNGKIQVPASAIMTLVISTKSL
jgi:hypothetical protein